MDLQINDFIKKSNAVIVEDDNNIAQLLKLNLIEMQFAQIDVFNRAEAAVEGLLASRYSICLLDWMLPGMQGVDLIKKHRSALPQTKIIMITAKTDPSFIVEGLEAGADDYLTKPFDARVLAAKVRQMMRRLQFELNLNQQIKKSESASDLSFPNEINFEGLSLNFSKHLSSLDGVDLHLTPSEFKLLSELIKAQGQVLTRDRLIELIQGEEVNVTGRTIDTHVFTLRKKLGAWAKHIETVRGVGYRVLISLSDTTEPVEAE